MKGPLPSWGLAILLAAMAACDRTVDASDLGGNVFADPKLSTSPLNVFSCATCHQVEPTGSPVIPGRFDAGFNLANAIARPTWWGGDQVRLLDAMNVCLEQFMGGRRLTPSDAAARQLYEYLAANSPEPSSEALPLTVKIGLGYLPGVVGDPGRGRVVWDAGCRRCHGEPHTGEGRLSARVSIVPEDTLAAFPTNARAAAIEKIRHGRFFNVGGVMPFYSLEVLSDADLANVLAYLGL